jgi:hypothetical protein
VHRLLPVLPVLRTGCALAAHWQHWQQHRPQPPERRPDQQSTSAGPSCWSERSGARISRVCQAEPGSRLTIAATFDIEGRQGSRRGVLVHHNHGPSLNNGSNQSSHGSGVLVMPDKRNRQRNAGACDSSREGLTGSKFGMEIRTCIARSCLGFLHTKTMSAICRPNTMSDKHVYQTYCVVTSL